MEQNILLAQLRALLERAPDLENYSPSSKEQMTWLAQGTALITRWDSMEVISFKVACQSLSTASTRQRNIGTIFTILYRAIADLELQVPSGIDASFGSGDVYDFFNALN